jgi:hypothetical protein
MPSPRPITRSLFAWALTAGLCASALAGEPDRVAWSSAEGTAIEDLSASDDGRWVAFTETGSDEVRFLDAHSWEVVGATAPCGGGSLGGVALAGSEGSYEAFAGCSDGSLVRITLDDWGVVEVGSGGGAGNGSGDTGDGGGGGDGWDSAVSLDGAGAVLAVETDGTTVYAVADQADGNPRAHKVDIASASETSNDSWPSLFGQSGCSDTWLGASYLFLSHGSQKVSKLQLSTGSISISNENISADMTDMDAVDDNAAFLANTEGGVIKYLPNGGTDTFQIMLDQYNSDLVSAQAVGIDGDEGYIAVYDDSPGEVAVFAFTNNAVGTTELERFEAASITELVSLGGYLVGGGTSGELQVITDRPWVEIATVDPSSGVISGQEVGVSFTSDSDGSYQLYYSPSDGGSAELLDEGDCSAGEETTARFTVGSGFEEGDNVLFVMVTARGVTGFDRTSMNVDNPPSAVSLSSDSETGVGFGDSQITVRFEGIDDEDLASYAIYVTVSEFDADDWPEGSFGGPAFDGEDDLSFPVEVSGASPGQDITKTISPVTNEVTYYVAVRAVDAGGQESAMSNVVSVTPQPTIGAAELAGETGGYCGTRSAWGFAALSLAGLLALGRRRGVGVAALLLALAVPQAQAGVDEDEHPRANGDVELRYGPYFPSVESVTDVYGDSGHGVLWLEGGVKITRFAELDVGMGFYQELATKVSVADTDYHSSEHTMITAWPFTAALTGRLDIFHEQLLVPTARIGMDYWLWKENWYVNPDVGGDSSIAGGELGWHWGVGGNLLLDRFDPRRASWLATSMGIDDTYLVVDWRTQTLGQWGEDGTSLFDGSMITVGLKLDM